MIKVLIDINVVLDVLLNRKVFYEYSAKVLTLCSNDLIEGYISADSFGTIFYILSKQIGKDKTKAALLKLRNIVKVSSVNEKVIDNSLLSLFKDFEDAVKYYSAVESDIKYIITRNEKDFENATLTAVNPEEFIENIY